MRGFSSVRPSSSRPASRGRGRAGLVAATVLALCTGGIVAGAGPASATQATGNDIAAWANNWSWTYQTTFNYNDGNGTNATINENVTYTVASTTDTFEGQDAYRLNITGTITGGSGTAAVEGVGNASLSNFAGSVSGTRYVRKADLALLQEQQQQNLTAKATVVIISTNITANINLTLKPSPGWRTHDFPLNAGDAWQTNESVAYTGGFHYDAGSYGSGDSPFDGTFPFNGPSTVSNTNISVPVGTVATNAISASSVNDDGTVTDNIWWAPTFKNDAKEHMQLPLDGATLTIDRNLSSASTPDPSPSITATATPSLSCAGGQVTVSGKLGSAAGVPVAIYLDKSQVTAGQEVTASATTGANGNYSTTVTVPSEPDGLSKNGSRANWGIFVSGGGSNAATTLVVTPKDCTTLTYTGQSSAPRDSDAVVTAQLTDLGGGSAASRQVTFSLDGGASVNATTNGSGLAVATLPTGHTVRNTTVRAHFAGNTTMEAADGSAPFAIGKVGTTTSVSPSLPSVEQNEAVTFTADVMSPQNGAGTPDGTVQFKVDGTDFGAAVVLSGGSATSASYSTNAIGSHTVTAVYSGSPDFLGSTSSDSTFEVTTPRAPSSTSETAAPGTSVFGQSVHLSATVTPNSPGDTPTGQVTFKRGATVLGTGVLDGAGIANLNTTALPVGTNSVVATYSGDGTYKSSSSAPQTVVVSQADVAVALHSSGSPTVTGQAVDFTASVSPVAPGAGTPTGTAQLQVDGSDIGSPVALIGGVATFDPVTSLQAGSHTVRAVYSGDTSFQSENGSTTQNVNKAGTTTTAFTTPPVTNEDVPFSVIATVVATAPGSGTPTGLVTFNEGSDELGSAALDGDGKATLELDTLAPGDHAITATYGGSANYNDSVSAPASHSVIEGAAVVPTTLQLSSSENPTSYGRLISFTAHVAADDGTTPTGGVQFSVDGTNLGGPVAIDANGNASSAQLAAPDPGDHTVIAAFEADGGYSGSGSVITQTVSDAAVNVDLSSSDDHSDHGQGVQFTAHVSSAQEGTASPTGFVQFSVDGVQLGDAVAIDGGTAVSPTVSDLGPGDHMVAALYSGDTHFVSDSSTLTQHVAKMGTSTTLAVSPASSTYGDPVDLTATVAPANDSLGAPTGSVAFVEGTTTLATAPVTAPVPAAGNNGTAHVQLSGLGAGSHSIKAVYSGSPSFEGSTSSATSLSIAKRATSIDANAAVVSLVPLGLPLGQLKISLHSSQGPIAGEPIAFKIGTNTVCTTTTDVNGVATCNAQSQLLALILFNGYTATFAGDANYLASSGRAGILK